MEERLGFIHDKLDIKILILFILRRLPEPVTFDVLRDLTLCDDGIGYFDFADESRACRHGAPADDGHTFALTERGAAMRHLRKTAFPLPSG